MTLQKTLKKKVISLYKDMIKHVLNLHKNNFLFAVSHIITS